MAEISLRPLTREDTGNIVRWRNNDFVRSNLYSQELLTEEQHLRYYESNIMHGKVRQYVIVAHQGDMQIDIGTVFFKHIDETNKKAEVGIFIGEKAYMGGGYGTAALKASLSTAFSDLSLNKVYATIMENNIPSRKIFAKVGFAESGLLLEDYLGMDGYQNVVMVEMTKNMWMKIIGGGGLPNL